MFIIAVMMKTCGLSCMDPTQQIRWSGLQLVPCCLFCNGWLWHKWRTDNRLDRSFWILSQVPCTSSLLRDQESASGNKMQIPPCQIMKRVHAHLDCHWGTFSVPWHNRCNRRFRQFCLMKGHPSATWTKLSLIVWLNAHFTTGKEQLHFW